MRKADRNRKRLNAGFTLVETMLALAILVLLTGIVASGIPVASQTYTKTVNTANAEVALTTTAALLRDELGMAQDVYYNPDSKDVMYYLSSDGYWAMIEKGAQSSEGSDGEDSGADEQALESRSLVKKVFYGADPANGGLTYKETVPLLPEQMAVGADANDLRVTFDDITYDNGVFTVSNLKVVDAKDSSHELATPGESGNLKIGAALL